jgi:pyruvate dehydrogenase E1 component beta subunit
MVDVLMPALSPTMEEGTLAKWLVSVGATIKSGQVIAEIETDKATMEVEAVDEGVLTEILVPAGTEGVRVNTAIARIVDGDSHAPTLPPPKPAIVETPAPTVTREPTPLRESPAKAPIAAVVSRYSGPTAPSTIRDALRDAMAEEMRRDPDVFLIGEEVAEYQGAYKVSRGLLEEFGPRRVIDTPITEHGFAGLAVGAAMSGLKPIVEFMTWNFAMQAIDHIINSAAKTLYMSGGQIRANVVFRGPNGAAARVGAQHSQDYSAWYAHVPGLKVIAPYDAADAKGLLKSAIRDPNPVVFLEHEMLYGDTHEVPTDPDYVVPIGKALVRREGSAVTITAHSRMVKLALQAADALSADGIEAEVIDLRTLRPLDEETILNSVRKTHRIVCVEEGWGRMGVGAEVAAIVTEKAFDDLDAPPLRVHQEDVPLPYAANLEALALPSTQKIIEAVKAVCYR